MKKTSEKIISGCDRLFFLFLFANPLLDLVYGIQVYCMNIGQYDTGGMLGSYQITVEPRIGLSLALRMALFAVMLLYLLALRDKKAMFTGAAMAAAFALTVGAEALRGARFSWVEDLLYAARFAFNIAAFLTYAHVLSRSPLDAGAKKRRADMAICYTLLVVALGVLIPFLFKIGYYTYADPLGCRGSRGMFFAGNDAVALMTLLLPLDIATLLQTPRLRSRQGIARLASVACCAIALVIMGTKTAFIVVITSAAMALLFAVFTAVKGGGAAALYRFAAACAVSLALYAVISLITSGGISRTVQEVTHTTGTYFKTEDLETAILSGRTTRMVAAWRGFVRALPLSLLAGVGRGTQPDVIEMDVVELFLYFGLCGTAAFAWLYLKNGVQLLRDVWRDPGVTGIFGMMALVLCCGYLFVAGHVLFSVTSGFYFALTLLYLRVFCAPPEGGARII